MTSHNGVRQLIRTCVPVGTLLALTGYFCGSKATLDDLGGLPRGTRDAGWPAQLADGLSTRHRIEQIFAIDRQGWTASRGWDMGCDEWATPLTLRPWNPT